VGEWTQYNLPRRGKWRNSPLQNAWLVN